MKVADMHCDTIMSIYQSLKKGQEISLRKNDLNISIEKNAKRGLFITVFCNVCSFSNG